MTDVSKSPVPRPAAVQWYYERDGVQVGPISEESLRHATRQGQIKSDTMVWQPAYDEWKEATRIPMLAAILGPSVKPLRTESGTLPRRLEPTKETPRAPIAPTASEPLAEAPGDESLAQPDLHDAVTDEEAADPTVDVEQVREILGRASRNPSGRWSTPASVASSSPPAPAEVQSLIGVPHLVGIVGVALLVGTLVVMLLGRQSDGQHKVPAAPAKTMASRGANEMARPAESDTSKPRPVSGGEPRLDTAPQQQPVFGGEPRILASARDEPQPIATPTPQSSARAKLDEVGATEHQAEPMVLTEGPLDVQLFLNKLRRALPMFDEQCWDYLRAPAGEVAKDPSIRIELSVDRLGHAYGFESSKPPPGYRGVGRCIIGRIRGWRFPRADAGTKVVMTIKRNRD